MSFNTKKCFVMHVTQKRIFTTPKYRLCGKDLEKVDHHPYLGVELSKDLKWNQHVHNISCNDNRMLGLLQRNLYKCQPSVKEIAYKTIVRPKVEYCASVWDPYTTTNIDELVMV